MQVLDLIERLGSTLDFSLVKYDPTEHGLGLLTLGIRFERTRFLRFLNSWLRTVETVCCQGQKWSVSFDALTLDPDGETVALFTVIGGDREPVLRHSYARLELSEGEYTSCFSKKTA